MTNLSLTSTIGAITLAATGAAGSASHLHAPLAVHHHHQLAVQEKLRDVMPQQHRQLQHAQQSEQNQRHTFATAPDDCPGTPFLWKITEDATGKHVGFGLGTMHLPLDVVTTQAGYISIEAVITDSCDVYGELNMLDPNVTAEIQACQTPIMGGSPTVEDIPDEDLKNAIKAKMLEIWTDIFPDDPELAEKFATRLLTLPLMSVQNMILLANTPEWSEKYLHTLHSGVGADPLDTTLIALGRPGNDLEEVATQCDIINTLNPSVEEFNQTFDLVDEQLWNSLNASLSEEIKMFTCGDVDAFVDDFYAGMAVEEFTNEVLLTERNKQMSAKMNEVLKASQDERVLFMVGLTHWIIGNQTLEISLKEYGYSLEKIPEWNHDLLEDHTNIHCGVMLNPETGLFDHAPAELFTPGAAPVDITSLPTHTVLLEDTPSPTVDNTTYALVLVEGPITSPTSGLTPITDDTKGSTAATPEETNNPTMKPSEVTPSEVDGIAVNTLSSSTMVGTSKLVLVGGFTYFWFYV